MATARKRSTSSRAKAAKPPKSAGVGDAASLDFLKPSKAKDKTSTSKQKPVSELPGPMGLVMDEWAAAHTVQKAAERKVAKFKAQILSHLLEDYATTWASGEVRPVTRTWTGNRSKFDYIVTSAITFTAAKQEAIQEELDIDMSSYFEVSKLEINAAKLFENAKALAAFQKFLESLDDKEEFVERKFSLKPNFFNNIGEICENDPDKIHKMLQILQPRITPKNISSMDKEEELFDKVRKMKG